MEFGWNLRVVGFICLGLMLISTLLVMERREAAAGTGPVNQQSLKKELTSLTYVLVTLGFTFAYLGMFIPFYYLPTYGQAHGTKPTMANNLLAILNEGLFFGRLISGYVADKTGV